MFSGKQIINLSNKTRLDVHVCLSEVKHNLHIEDSETDDDVEITRLIEAAATAAKSYTDHYFAHTEIDYVGYNFKESTYKMNVSPIDSLVSFETSVDNITWVDITDTIDVEKRESDFTLHFAEEIDSLYIRFTINVGYPTNELPEDAKDAIIVKASDMFDTESSSYVAKLTNNKTFETLLGAYVNTRWT